MNFPLLIATLTLAVSCSGGSNAKDGAPRADKRTPSFVRMEAERWSFEHQMKKLLRHYSGAMQSQARDSIAEREQIQAKLPERDRSVIVEEGNGEVWRAEVHLENGWMEGLHSIGISFEDILAYQNLDVLFAGDIRFLENIKVTHNFSVSKDGALRREGIAEAQTEDLHFLFTARLNLESKRIEVLQLQRRCLGGINVDKILGDGGQMAREISKVVTEICIGPVMNDIELLTFAALEVAAAQLGQVELPKYNYGKRRSEGNEGNKRSGNVTMCPEDSANTKAIPKIIKRGINLRVHDYLPFIQNDAEMWSFEAQLKKYTNEFVDNFVLKASNLLIERGLRKAKLPGFERIINLKEECGSDQNVIVKLSNGWLTGIENFVSRGVDLVTIDKKLMTLSASIGLFKDIELSQEINVGVLNTNSGYSIRGHVKSMTFSIKITVNLETFDAALKDFRLKCIDEIQWKESFGGTNNSCLENVVSRAANGVFNGPIVNNIHGLLHHALEYTFSKMEIQGYLPKWNYKKNFERRFYVKPKHKLQICSDRELSAALRKETENGYTTVVRSVPVPFIDTELELREFGNQLAVSMNKYLKAILHETKSIIIIRGLQKPRIRVYIRPFSAKDYSGEFKFGVLSFFNGTVENVSDIFEGIDLIDNLEFDAKGIVLTTRIPVWWNLKLESDILVSVKKEDIKGVFRGHLDTAVYHFKIRIDYLGSRNVTVEELHLECLGGIMLKTKDFPQRSGWISEAAVEKTISFFTRNVWRDIHDVFHRSLEDAISNNDLMKFLPPLDYERDYRNGGEDRRTKLKGDLKLCQTMKTKGTTTSANRDENVGFEKFLPQIQTVALRMHIEGKIKEQFGDYMGEIWTSTIRDLSERFRQANIPNRSTSFVLKDSFNEVLNVSLNLGKGTMHISPPPDVVHEGEILYGENSTVLLVSTLTFKAIKVEQEFILNIGGSNLKGSIVIIVENWINILKSRINISSSHMKIEDFDIYCAESVKSVVQGLDKDYEWLSEIVVMESIEVTMTPLLKDILVETMDSYEETVERRKSESPIPGYVRDEKLYSIATREEDDTEKQREEKLRNNCTSETEILDYKHEDRRKMPPFIGTEAEWGFFKKEMKRKIESFQSDFLRGVRDYMILNNFQKINLSDYTRPISVKDPLGVTWNGELLAKNGTAENLAEIDFGEGPNFEFDSKEVIFQIYLRFKNGLKFRHNFISNITFNVEDGVIDGSVEELTYVLKIRVNWETKHFRLEDPLLNCIGRLKSDVKARNDSLAWLSAEISAVASRAFLGPILNDVEKIVHIVLQEKISYLNVQELGNLYLPKWNYKKNYHTLIHVMGRDFRNCNQTTAEGI